MNFGFSVFMIKVKHPITKKKVRSYGVISKEDYSTLIKSSSNNKSEILNKKTNKLNPNFITGFIDAEGSFITIVRKEPLNKTG